MLNTGKLAGKTLFITGASRGIGKAIALKAAKDGANIVIAAKSAEQQAKLPGTIYSAAEEIEKAGGKCLPCKVDIRNEDEVQKAVDECLKRFGGVDILVNNASAISLTGTLETPMKKYDLMNQINARGTFLVSQKCIPHLKKASNPHILNLSPPLNMNPIWFSNHVAYTMAKYGMSMCALGMAEELKPFKIAVNALWPRTAIWTAAMKMLSDEAGRSKCRKPEILSDAAYVILTKDSKSFTGQFCIDDEILKAQGITDLDQYAEVPGTTDFMPDFFLPEAEAGYKIMLSGQQQQQQSAGTPSAGASEKGAGSIGSMFKKIQPTITPELVGTIKAIFKFELTGSEPGVWYLDLKNSDKAGYGSGECPSGTPDVIFNCESEQLVKMFYGKSKPTLAFMTGKLKIQGNLGLAMKLEKLLSQLKSKL